MTGRKKKGSAVVRRGMRVPQGLKPVFCQGLIGTAEAVPFPKPIL